MWIPSTTWSVYISFSVIGANCSPFVELYRLDDNDNLVLIDSADGLLQTGILNGLMFESGDYYLRVTNKLGPQATGTEYEISISGADEGGPFIGALAGVVKGASSGTPISGATVTVERIGALESNTDGSGIYTFATLPAQSYQVIASAPWHESKATSASVTVGINTLDFDLDALPRSVLTVTTDEASVGVGSGSVVFDVVNAGTPSQDLPNEPIPALSWTASVLSGGDWASIQAPGTGSDNDDLTVNYNANPTGSSRIAEIQLSDPDALNSPVLVTITQDPNTTPVLSIAPTSRPVSSDEGQTTFAVTNTGFGTLTYTAAVITGGEWLTLDVGSNGGTITALIAANPTGDARTGEIEVTAPGALDSPQIVTVQQAANTTPVMTVEPSLRTVNSAAGTTTFTVSNVGFGVLNWSANVTSGGDWLAISLSKTGGGGTITADYNANPTGVERSATITVEDANAIGSPILVTVTQAANTTPVLSVTPLERVVGADAGIVQFDIANAGFGTLTWEAVVTTGGDWLTLVGKNGGTGDATVEAVYASNLSELGRVAEITITANVEALNSPQVVVVRQGGDQTPALEVQPRIRSIGAEGGDVTFAITNPGHGTLNWSASVFSDADWVTLGTKATGIDDGELIVNCAANDQTVARGATVRISCEGATGSPIDITIQQDGAEGPATDLNGDNTIDAVDVQLIVNAALGLEGLGGDVNGDSAVDAVDVQLVINAALGL